MLTQKKKTRRLDKVDLSQKQYLSRIEIHVITPTCQISCATHDIEQSNRELPVRGNATTYMRTNTLILSYCQRKRGEHERYMNERKDGMRQAGIFGHTTGLEQIIDGIVADPSVVIDYAEILAATLKKHVHVLVLMKEVDRNGAGEVVFKEFMDIKVDSHDDGDVLV